MTAFGFHGEHANCAKKRYDSGWSDGSKTANHARKRYDSVWFEGSEDTKLAPIWCNSTGRPT